VRPRVDWASVGLGALIGLAVYVPTFALVQLVGSRRGGVACASRTPGQLFVVVLAGWALGGWVAARRRPDLPFVHGALAGLLSYAPVAVTSAVVRAVRHHASASASASAKANFALVIVFIACLAVMAGLIGGLVSTRRPRASSR
jgi:hypothetical protein